MKLKNKTLVTRDEYCFEDQNKKRKARWIVVVNNVHVSSNRVEEPILF